MKIGYEEIEDERYMSRRRDKFEDESNLKKISIWRRYKSFEDINLKKNTKIHAKMKLVYDEAKWSLTKISFSRRHRHETIYSKKIKKIRRKLIEEKLRRNEEIFWKVIVANAEWRRRSHLSSCTNEEASNALTTKEKLRKLEFQDHYKRIWSSITNTWHSYNMKMVLKSIQKSTRYWSLSESQSNEKKEVKSKVWRSQKSWKLYRRSEEKKKNWKRRK